MRAPGDLKSRPVDVKVIAMNKPYVHPSVPIARAARDELLSAVLLIELGEPNSAKTKIDAVIELLNGIEEVKL